MTKKNNIGGLQNIGASHSDDAFYRYKMPKMITKIDGRGNGIKTSIVNMAHIAKALARPPAYVIKYFGCELGTQSKFDDKSGAATVNGAHDTPKLAGLLDNFIRKYVQCYGCGNPETEIAVAKKTQTLRLKCAACGFVSEVDMRDKVANFIVKNPPEERKDKKATTRRADKEPTAKKKPPGSSKKKDDDNDDDVEWQTDNSLEAAKQRSREQLSAVTANMVALSMNGVELVEEIKECLKKEASPSEAKSFSGSLPGTRQEIMDALVEALFEGVGKGFAKEVAKKGKYLAAVAGDGGSQTMLLRAMESFCGQTSPDAAKELAQALKSLYDDDVLEEDFLLDWYNNGIAGHNKSSALWMNVRPFAQWLQTAESQSDGD